MTISTTELFKTISLKKLEEENTGKMVLALDNNRKSLLYSAMQNGELVQLDVLLNFKPREQLALLDSIAGHEWGPVKSWMGLSDEQRVFYNKLSSFYGKAGSSTPYQRFLYRFYPYENQLAKQKRGLNELMLAVLDCNLKAVKAQLKINPAQMLETNHNNQTALMLAVSLKYPAIVNQLLTVSDALKEGVKKQLLQRDNDKSIPLYRAICNESILVVYELLKQFANEQVAEIENDLGSIADVARPNSDMKLYLKQYCAGRQKDPNFVLRPFIPNCEIRFNPGVNTQEQGEEQNPKQKTPRKGVKDQSR